MLGEKDPIDHIDITLGKCKLIFIVFVVEHDFYICFVIIGDKIIQVGILIRNMKF